VATELTCVTSREPDLYGDPFGERSAIMSLPPVRLLGASFRFESNSSELLGLADAAFAGLPHHRIGARAPELRVRMMLTAEKRRGRRSEPPPLVMASGAGILAAGTSGASSVAMDPKAGVALISVSHGMLRFPYHVRYELIEFVVYTLAARAQRLAPLHCACVGTDGKAVLLMGETGAGKSTVALQCLLEGLDFVSEDSTLVAPGSMRATGLANYLHVRSDSVSWLDRPREVNRIRRSPVIRRRSGARKFEVDLRARPFRLAAEPPRVRAVVFLSSASAAGGPMLTRVPKTGLSGRLGRLQPYAAGLALWDPFCRGVARAGAFELRRGRHPRDSVVALRDLLGT
jgi:hypothetical protein